MLPSPKLIPFAAVSFTDLIASWTVLAPATSPIFWAVRLPAASTVVLEPRMSFTLFCALYSCPPLIASLELDATVPAATLVIFRSPALIPVLVMLGPVAWFVASTKLKPSWFNTVSPAVRLSTVMSFAKASCTPSVVVVLVTLLSPFTLIVSPSL